MIYFIEWHDEHTYNMKKQKHWEMKQRDDKNARIILLWKKKVKHITNRKLMLKHSTYKTNRKRQKTKTIFHKFTHSYSRNNAELITLHSRRDFLKLICGNLRNLWQKKWDELVCLHEFFTKHFKSKFFIKKIYPSIKFISLVLHSVCK